VNHAILLVTRRSRAARHGTGNADALLMLVCDLPNRAALRSRWWDPVGMRATASHLGYFDNLFIPDETRSPGRAFFAAIGRRVSRRNMPRASSRRGAAFDYALTRSRTNRASILRAASCRSHGDRIETAHLWLHRVGRL